MSSTFQWRGRLVSGMLLVVAAVVAVLGLVPTTSFAHPGHDHGFSSATGRQPGVPDYQKIGGVTIRFDAKSREYVVDKPGKPPERAHIEMETAPVVEGLEANGGHSPLPSQESQPVCATSGRRFVVIRAYDEGTKTPDTEDALIRSIVKRMNWKFMQQSQLSSNPDRTLQMKVNCDGSGAVTVQDVSVPFGYIGKGVDTTDGNIDQHDTRLYIQEKLGEPEGSNTVKYLIFIDKDIPNFVGVGYRYPGQVEKNINNINANDTTSAVVDRGLNHTTDGKDSWESTIPIHESLHVMNASLNEEVEPGKWVAAPYATTNGHCIDGIDILCYADKSNAPEGSYSEGRCPAWAGHESAERVPIDCKFDTFFDAETEPGEWLSKWWNVGGTENPFLVHTPGVPPVATAFQAFTTSADLEIYNATLKGLVNPGGVATTYKFEYGTTTSYGNSAPVSSKSIGSGIEDVEVSETITIEPEVTYHYRVVATSSKGTSHGKDMTVKTSLWGVQAIQGPSSNGGRGDLLDVSCSSSIHCVAVGSNKSGAPLAEHWGDGKWSIAASASPEGYLERVSCSSASFCIAAGKVGNTLLSEHWNGSSWSSVSLPVPTGSKGSVIKAISCTSSTTCIAVGSYAGPKGSLFELNTLVEYWDGSKWSIVSSPNVEGNAFNQLSEVSCMSAMACLAVGSTNKTGGTFSPLVLKWDGSKWWIASPPTPPGGIGYIHSISCPTASFCMVSGAGSDGKTFTASWDGANWKVLASGMPGELRSISCATQSSCGLVGFRETGRHWNGSEWIVRDLVPAAGGAEAYAYRVSCPGPSLCTAVGTYTGVPFFSPGTRPLAARLTPAPHVEFRSEKYSKDGFTTTATAIQSGSHKLTNEKSQSILACSTATATATLAEPSSTLALLPAYKGCALWGLGAAFNGNGCKFVVFSTNDKEPFTGSVEIACNKEGDGLEFTSSGCTLRLPAQKAVGSVSLSNTGKKSRGRTITASLSLTGVEYAETSKGGCGEKVSKSGTYTGTYVISGYESPVGFPEDKEPVGLYLAKEQVIVPPLIEAEKYSAVVEAGNASMSVSMSPMAFSCTTTGAGQGLLSASSKELGLKFQKWTGCYWGGGFSISTNGCSFVLRPLVGQLPYTTGSADISCPEGKEITFSTPSALCEVKIPSQTNLSSIKTESTGSGTSRSINVSLALQGLTYTQTKKGLCGEPGTFSNGSLSGTWTLKGYVPAGTTQVEGETVYLKGAQLGIWAE